MKNMLIALFLFLSFSAFSQSAIVIGNDTDTTWRYNTWSEFVKSRFYVNPTGKENKFFKINAAGNGFDFVDPNNFSGSGSANHLAYWTSSSGLSSNSNFTFNPSTRAGTFGTAGLSMTFDFLSTGNRIRFQDFGATVWSTTAGAETWATMSYDNGPYGRVTLYDPGNVIAARLGGSGDNYTKRNFGIGTTTPANALHVYKTDANNAVMTYVARFGHGTNGTAGVGVATGFEFALEDNAGNMDVVATTDIVSTSVTNGSESADIVWKSMQAGTLAERARLSGSLLTVGSIGVGASPNASSLFDVTSTTKGTRPAPGMTTTQRNAISSPTTGLQVYNTSLNKLNFYNGSAWRAVLDSTTADARFAILGGNNGPITIGTNNTTPFHFETGGTRRFSIPSSGIAYTPSSTKALVLSPDDSLGYTTLQSADFTATVTQSGSDTLQNTATCYGFFQRTGNYVDLDVRIEVAFTSTGNANTFYFDPPIASDFTTDKTDVIGRGGLDTQALSSTNIPQQRCLAFASTADDKIGISVDPPDGLTYPDNRMYITVQLRYVIQ